MIASFEGYLRIYAPKEGGFTHDHLILEKYLEDGILQIQIGKFTTVNEFNLAVLHSRRLSIYTVEREAEHSSKLVLQYEHQMDRNSFNFISGKFGKKELGICVQSIDGQLSFFNQETPQMQIQLADFYLPGPFIYAEDQDSIVVSNTCYEIECYSYATLNAQANQNKKAVPVWVCNIGEQAFHMMQVKVQSKNRQNVAKYDIVVVGDQTLFILNQGKIRY